MNIEKGKELFYKYYGNRFGIQNDLGMEYEKCKIPKSLEDEWLKDIKNILKTKIESNECVGFELLCYIRRYAYLFPLKDIHECVITIEKCFNRNIDTFTKIRICEDLKDLLSPQIDDSVRTQIQNIIIEQKAKMVRQEIIVDEYYRKTMEAEKLTSENIIKRMMGL